MKEKEEIKSLDELCLLLYDFCVELDKMNCCMSDLYSDKTTAVTTINVLVGERPSYIFENGKVDKDYVRNYLRTRIPSMKTAIRNLRTEVNNIVLGNFDEYFKKYLKEKCFLSDTGVNLIFSYLD